MKIYNNFFFIIKKNNNKNNNHGILHNIKHGEHVYCKCVCLFSKKVELSQGHC